MDNLFSFSREAQSLLQRDDLLAPMNGSVVHWHALVVLRRIRRVRRFGRRQASAESTANDVHHQKYTEYSQNHDDRNGRRSPTSRVLMRQRHLGTAGNRDRTYGTASARFRGLRITASHGANGFSAAESADRVADASRARIRHPGRAFGMRLVSMIDAGCPTTTHLTATFTGLQPEGALLLAVGQSCASNLFLTLAKRAAVLVVNQTVLAVQIAAKRGTHRPVIVLLN